MGQIFVAILGSEQLMAGDCSKEEAINRYGEGMDRYDEVPEGHSSVRLQWKRKGLNKVVG